MPDMSESERRKPVASKRFDRVRAAVWLQGTDPADKNEPLYAFSVTRNYRDANGHWHRSTSFLARDLPHLQLAVEWAIREIILNAEDGQSGC
jgi:hypothetical protein